MVYEVFVIVESLTKTVILAILRAIQSLHSFEPKT